MNRRTFVKTTAAFSTLAAAGSAFAPERKLRKGIMYATIEMKSSVLENLKP